MELLRFYGAIQTLHHPKGWEGLLIFVTKGGKGWEGCFCSVTSDFLDNSIFSTFCFKIENLAIFEKKFGFTSKNNLAIQLGCHFEAKKDIINTLL